MINSTKAAVSDAICRITLDYENNPPDANEELTKFTLEFALECTKYPPNETVQALDDRLIKFCDNWETK